MIGSIFMMLKYSALVAAIVVGMFTCVVVCAAALDWVAYSGLVP
jgi:hypothetical protein